MAWNVVIAGGGFGGLYAARTLERRLAPQSARIILVNDANFMLYTPLLPGAAGGTLEPRHVVVPLRSILRRSELLLGRVESADPTARRVEVTTLDGRTEALAYDHLVLALGSVSRDAPVPGLREHAMAFKSLAHAIALRNHLLATMDIAEAIEDAELRREWLTYVFVGAGYAGVEGLAELEDFAADVIDLYPRCRQTGMRWMLLELGNRIMPEVGPSLSDYTVAQLRARGMEVHPGMSVGEITERSVTLTTGERVPTRTVVWTAGVRPHPTVSRLGVPLAAGSGRIEVDRYMRVKGCPDVWAIGDAAAVPDPAQRGERPCPPTAQHAIRQGRRVAENVAASIGSRRLRPFRYRTMGVVVDLGRNRAVASTIGIRWRGFPAWFIARTYHLMLMPSLGRKVRLLVDWNVGLLFGRDPSELGQLGHPPALAEDAAGQEGGAGGRSPAAPAGARQPASGADGGAREDD